jgi:hypothetical protein
MKTKKQYVAQISMKQKRGKLITFHIGNFMTAEEAYNARKEFIQRLF